MCLKSKMRDQEVVSEKNLLLYNDVTAFYIQIKSSLLLLYILHASIK